MIVHAVGLALRKRLRSTRKSSHILEGMPCANENLKLVSESFALPVPTLYVPPSRNIEPDVDRVINYDASFLGPVLVIPPHLPFLRQLPRPYKIPFSSTPKFMFHDVTHGAQHFLDQRDGCAKEIYQKIPFSSHI